MILIRMIYHAVLWADGRALNEAVTQLRNCHFRCLAPARGRPLLFKKSLAIFLPICAGCSEVYVQSWPLVTSQCKLCILSTALVKGLVVGVAAVGFSSCRER